MKFDFVIGNPPYQEEKQGDSNTATPVYHSFIDAAYGISDRTMLITPARFLFNAGYTPKEWNQKMLNDEHLKVLSYEPNSASVFNGVDIKGGVAITYHDTQISRKVHLTKPSKKAHLHQVSFSTLDKSPFTRPSRGPKGAICGM